MKISAYEERRQRTLEENKKRFEQLNLNKIVQSLHTLNTSLMKKVKPKVPRQPIDPNLIRRSSRVADKPLGLPVDFCKKHFPKHDETICLIDEEGKEFTNKYLVEKSGLSAGWRGFARYQKLVHGDVVVFQLTEPTTFKVYIISVNS